MNKQSNRSSPKIVTQGKRNRIFQLALLPEIVFMWIIGWSLFWLGSKKAPSIRASSPSPANLAHYVVMPEEKLITQ